MRMKRDHQGRLAARLLGYCVGFGLAILMTATSFFIAGTDLVWQPSIPVALVVLAIAQMGVHLVFFIHITTDPDNTNNILALAFGLLIVFLVVGGSLWIMSHLNQNMPPIWRRKPRPFCPISCTTTTGLVSIGPLESALRFSSAMSGGSCPSSLTCKEENPPAFSRSRRPYRARKEK